MGEDIPVPEINPSSILSGREVTVLLEGGIIKKGLYLNEDQEKVYLIVNKQITFVYRGSLRMLTIEGTPASSKEDILLKLKKAQEKIKKHLELERSE